MIVPNFRSRRDGGFTLVETLITIVIVGFVSVVIAGVFSVIVRTSPTTEARTDDARALLGLTNWLPQDVLSTAESGFRARPPAAVWKCGGAMPTATGLLELTWAEGSSYAVYYLFIDKSATTGRIYRYSCRQGQAATALSMTPELAKIPIGSPSAPSEAPTPVNLTLVPTVMANGSPGTQGIEFEVVILDPETGVQRELISLDAFTANVVTTLPPTTTTPGATTTSTAPNQPPVADDRDVDVYLDTLTAVTVTAIDPEGGALNVTTITINDPQLVVPVPSSGLIIDVTADSASGAAELGNYSFDYTVTDNAGGSDSGIVTVHVIPSTTPTTTTTTTTTTSTTTTTLPCAASFVSVVPNPVGRKGNGLLKSNVVVTISTNGWCQPLVLSFDPDPTDANMTPQAIPFNSGTVVTIGANTYVWTVNGSPGHPLEIRQAANGAIMATTNLRVVPAP